MAGLVWPYNRTRTHEFAITSSVPLHPLFFSALCGFKKKKKKLEARHSGPEKVITRLDFELSFTAHDRDMYDDALSRSALLRSCLSRMASQKGHPAACAGARTARGNQETKASKFCRLRVQ